MFEKILDTAHMSSTSEGVSAGVPDSDFEDLFEPEVENETDKSKLVDIS